jgi:hypothetical protein
VRAQVNLVALAVALVLVTGATVVGVGLADSALAGADRDPLDRHVAAGVAARLTAADSPVTVRENALDAAAVARLNATRIAELAPPATDADVRIALDDTVVAERGDPRDGTTVRRSVVSRSRTEPTTAVRNLSREPTVDVPRGVERATVDVDAGANTTVRSVRANGRVLLYDGSGLNGTETVSLDRYERTTLRVETAANATGRVAVTYRRGLVQDRRLTVTADA